MTPNLSKQIDEKLIQIAWSLWTELGVAGVIRNHKNSLIALEELVILTSVIAKNDPRLRDEALDWCVMHHHFVSISRLRHLLKKLNPFIQKSYSTFAATLNEMTSSNWPVTVTVQPWKSTRSYKSKTPSCDRPALLFLKLRALFGVGARADLFTFFLMQEKTSCTAADAAEVGYSKRSLSTLLDDFVFSKVFEAHMVRNQKYYTFSKRKEMIHLLGCLPEKAPNWSLFLEVLLPIRECVQNIENKSLAIQATEIRNLLSKLKNNLQKFYLFPHISEIDFEKYLEVFSNWVLEFLALF